MPKREVVRRIDQRAAGSAGGTGGVAASGNADTVDGLHASRTPTAGYLLALGSDAQFPADVVALDDVAGVTVEASPADNEVLAYDQASGQWINQTADEANLQTKLTTGNLTASSPLQASATRQVIGGALTLSLDPSGIDHGSLGGLGDDDHTQYLLASGARAGSASQAQSFGATGIKADVVAEATTNAGVTAGGVLLKNAGATFGADVNFAGYKAVAMTCDRGTNFPSSPTTGQWFYRTDAKCLFFYEGDWKPIISFGDMTLYVDGTNGSDSPGKGFSSGSGATKTIQYAVNLIPAIVGGNVTVNIAAGTYAESVTIPNRVVGPGYTISLVGAITQVASGTITDFKRSTMASGTGKVNTPSGGSTTVTLTGGGSTSAFWVGAVIWGEDNQSRIVTGITDSTTFTVNSAVDWYNGGAGRSYKIWQSIIADSSATWTDDQHNNRLLCTNLGGTFDSNLIFIRDTDGTNKRLLTGGIMANTPTAGSTQYGIYTLDTSITGSSFRIYCSSVSIKYLKMSSGIQAYNLNPLAFYGCEFFNQSGYICLLYGSIWADIYGCLARNTTRGFSVNPDCYLRLHRVYMYNSSLYCVINSGGNLYLNMSWLEHFAANTMVIGQGGAQAVSYASVLNRTASPSSYGINMAKISGYMGLSSTAIIGCTTPFFADSSSYGWIGD